MTRWAGTVAIIGGAVLLVAEHGVLGLVAVAVLGAALLLALPRR